VKFGISIGARGLGRGNNEPAELVRYVQAAESAGVHYAWSAESWGRDAVTPLAYLAAVTKSITLGPGIMQITARTPSMTAMTALSLNELAPGRFVLGLGVSGPQVVEGLHGVPFNPALTRLRETVAIVRKAVAGERLEHDGKVFQLPLPGGQGKALRIDHAHDPKMRIFLATLGPNALEFTGESADGWLGTSFSPNFADAHLSFIKKGAASAGRSIDDIEIQASANVAVTDDVEPVVAALKPGVAFTLGAMGSAKTNFYNAAFIRAGFEDDARAVQSLWLEGKRDAAAARVPDDLVLQFGLIGTPAMIRDRLALYQSAGVKGINLRFTNLSGDDRIDALERTMEVLNGS
jgi:F420-dependent oxidoreductase-like protein